MLEFACATDERYAAPTAAMLHSLLRHLGGAAARIRVLHDGTLSDRTLARYAKLASSSNAQCIGVVVDDALLQGFPIAQFHKSCWYRVLLPQLCPELSRIIYLDSDLIVADDLAPLWQLPLAPHPFAAVANPIYYFLGNWPRDQLGIDDPARYLNSGVMLFDLARLRSMDFIDAVRRYAAAHPDNRYPEQDALSALYQHSFLGLHPRWNVQSTFYELTPEQIPFSAHETAQALAAPAAVHFIGPFKPWTQGCPHPRRALYQQHLQAAGWAQDTLTPAPDLSAELAYYHERITWRWRVRRLPLLARALLLRTGYALRDALPGKAAVPLLRSS